MSEQEKSVFDRLDSIESQQSTTQSQNEEIIKLLKNLNQKTEAVVPQKQSISIQPTDQQKLRDFLKNAKKEYIWLGKEEDFRFTKFKTRIL